MGESLQTRFGVELEICVRIGEDCLAVDGEVTELDWMKSFRAYFTKMLSKCTPEFLGLHTEVAVLGDFSQYFIYNLRDPFVDDKPNYHAVDDNSEEYKKISEYKIPIFMFDASVICGDTALGITNVFNENLKTLLQPQKSFNIECITPVLSFMGEPTKEKVNAALRPYLEFFGLGTPHCFIANHTAGFHVNVSVLDTVKYEVLPIIDSPLFLHILEQFVTVEERLYYSQFRARQPFSVNGVEKPPLNYSWAKPAFKVVKRIMENESIPKERKEEAILAAFMTKHHSIKRKWPSIIEFRVFQSERDIDKLIENTLLACQIVKQGIEESFAKKGSGRKNESVRSASRNNNEQTIRLRNITRRRRKRHHHRLSRKV